MFVGICKVLSDQLLGAVRSTHFISNHNSVIQVSTLKNDIKVQYLYNIVKFVLFTLGTIHK